MIRDVPNDGSFLALFRLRIMALHITYSNSYEVLITILGINLHFDKDASLKRLFNPIQIVVPSKEVENAVLQKLCTKSGVSIGYRFSNLAEWLRPYGAFWHTASIESFKLPWAIYPILLAIQTGKESLTSSIENYENLREHLIGKSPAEVFSLAERIAHVFTKYVNYRYDWVYSWITNTPLSEEETKALEQQPEFLWQKSLWKELHAADEVKERTTELPYETQYTNKICALAKQLLGEEKAGFEKNTSETPVHIFLPHSLPPLSLPVLAKEAQNREVHLYILNPCCEYWFDPLDNKIPEELFARRGSDPGWEKPATRNRLLHENGASIRAFIDRLWCYAPDEGFTKEKLIEDSFTRQDPLVHVNKMRRLWKDVSEKSISEVDATDQSMYWRRRVEKEGAPLTLLDAIVNSILFDSPLQGNGADFTFDAEAFDPKKDKSLRIFKATGLAAQIEATMDWVDALTEEKGYRADDFLVVTPDITAASGLIRGIFNARAPEKRIDFKILGEIDASQSAPLEAFHFLFLEPDFETFFQMVSSPLFMHCWDIDYDEIAIWRNWLAAAGFRSAVTEAHEKRLGIGVRAEAIEENDMTLSRALERLALGFTYGDENTASFGRSLAISGSEIAGFDTVSREVDLFKKLLTIGEVLKGLLENLEELACASEEEGYCHTAAQWKQFSLALLDGLYPARSLNLVRDAREEFSETIESLHETVMSALPTERETIDATVYLASLERAIGVCIKQSRRDGSVTFASMDALRDIPFKAIAMIGLDEDSKFPGDRSEEEFDLTCMYRNRESAPKARRGDQDSRVDNRAVFLELLCAAEKNILITYDAGENILDKPMSASSVIEDLSQWLKEEAPGVVDKITGILPASRYARESFVPTDEKRFFSNRNPEEFEAFKSSLSSKKDASAEDFLRGYKVDRDSASEEMRTVTFRALCQAWIYPEDYVLGNLSLETTLEDECAAPRILPLDLDENPLRKSQLVRMLRKELDTLYPKLPTNLTKEEIVDSVCSLPSIRLNPQLGGSSLRELGIRDFVDMLYGFKEKEEKIASDGLTEHDFGYVTFEKFRLKLPAIQVLKAGENDETIDFLYSAYTGADMKRAAILQLALNASDYAREKGKHFRLRLIYSEDKKAQEFDFGRDESSDVKFDPSTISNEEARDLLYELLNYEEALCTQIRVAPKAKSSQNNDKEKTDLDPIWRGFDKDEERAQSTKEALNKAFILSFNEKGMAATLEEDISNAKEGIKKLLRVAKNRLVKEAV